MTRPGPSPELLSTQPWSLLLSHRNLVSELSNIIRARCGVCAGSGQGRVGWTAAIRTHLMPSGLLWGKRDKTRESTSQIRSQMNYVKYRDFKDKHENLRLITEGWSKTEIRGGEKTSCCAILPGHAATAAGCLSPGVLVYHRVSTLVGSLGLPCSLDHRDSTPLETASTRSLNSLGLPWSLDHRDSTLLETASTRSLNSLGLPWSLDHRDSTLLETASTRSLNSLGLPWSPDHGDSPLRETASIGSLNFL
ncbi:hypothetical protein RRG08_024867 [Elysia crispata]|uniref:Uncharacterized protein n=1 Tax=Elysia crispata TaxID=231223 RepID=A0AAE0YJJ9_9GAST|nr:hypothetical protein RRG08_024867 [Elysia crispata]